MRFNVVAVTAAVAVSLLYGPAAAAQEPLPGAGEPVAVSAMGPADEVSTTARFAAVASDPGSDRSLVVWVGATDPGATADVDVYGAFVGPGGVEPQFQITDLGGPGQPTFTTGVDVAYNPVRDEFLVAWAGAVGQVNPDFDIWVQRLDAASGDAIGEAARISSLTDPILIVSVSIAHNAVDDDYLVTWTGRDDVPEPPLERFEDEVYGQLLDGDATEIGPDDLRISRIQGDGDTGLVETFGAHVAHDPARNEYLVVWDGLAYLGGEILLPDLEIEQYHQDVEFEIFGRRLDAAGGFLGDELLISADELPGPPPEPLPAEWPSDDLDAVLPGRSTTTSPRVAYNPVAGGFLVIWMEDGAENGLARSEFEVFGRLVGPGGSLGDELRVSDHGTSGELLHRVQRPDVSIDGVRGEALVVWAAADPRAEPAEGFSGPSLLDDAEVWGQIIDAAGELGPGPFQLTETGGVGDGDYEAFDPAVAWAGSAGRFVLVWSGNEPGMAAVDQEFAGQVNTVFDVEVFARRLDTPEPPAPPTTTTTSTIAATTSTSTLGADAPTTTTAAPASTSTIVATDEGGGGGGGIAIVAIAVVALAAIGGGAVLVTRRRSA